MSASHPAYMLKDDINLSKFILLVQANVKLFFPPEFTVLKYPSLEEAHDIFATISTPRTLAYRTQSPVFSKSQNRDSLIIIQRFKLRALQKRISICRNILFYFVLCVSIYSLCRNPGL